MPFDTSTHPDIEETSLIDALPAEVWPALSTEFRALPIVRFSERDRSITLGSPTPDHPLDHATLTVTQVQEGTQLKLIAFRSSAHKRQRRRAFRAFVVTCFLVGLAAGLGPAIEDMTLRANIGLVLTVVAFSVLGFLLSRLSRNASLLPFVYRHLEAAAIATGITLSFRGAHNRETATLLRALFIVPFPCLLFGLSLGLLIASGAQSALASCLFFALIYAFFAIPVYFWLRTGFRQCPHEATSVSPILTLSVAQFGLLLAPVLLFWTALQLERHLLASDVSLSVSRATSIHALELFIPLFILAFGFKALLRILATSRSSAHARYPVWARPRRSSLTTGSGVAISVVLFLATLLWIATLWAVAILWGIAFGDTIPPGAGVRLMVQSPPPIVSALAWAVATVYVLLLVLPFAYFVAHFSVQLAQHRRQAVDHNPGTEVEDRLLEKVWETLCLLHTRRPLPLPSIGIRSRPDISIASVPRIFRRRPGVIILSTGAIRHLSNAELEAVLAHECAHLMRHRKYVWLSDALSLFTLSGFGLLGALVNWKELEDEADRIAVDYTLATYETEDVLISALRKCEAVNDSLSLLRDRQRYLGFALDELAHDVDRPPRGAWGTTVWFANIVFFTGLVGYCHAPVKARERAIRSYAKRPSPIATTGP